MTAAVGKQDLCSFLPSCDMGAFQPPHWGSPLAHAARRGRIPCSNPLLQNWGNIWKESFKSLLNLSVFWWEAVLCWGISSWSVHLNVCLINISCYYSENRLNFPPGTEKREVIPPCINSVCFWPSANGASIQKGAEQISFPWLILAQLDCTFPKWLPACFPLLSASLRLESRYLHVGSVKHRGKELKTWWRKKPFERWGFVLLSP